MGNCGRSGPPWRAQDDMLQEQRDPIPRLAPFLAVAAADLAGAIVVLDESRATKAGQPFTVVRAGGFPSKVRCHARTLADPPGQIASRPAGFGSN